MELGEHADLGNHSARLERYPPDLLSARDRDVQARHRGIDHDAVRARHRAQAVARGLRNRSGRRVKTAVEMLGGGAKKDI
jgi:hypothetical protein